MQKTITRRNFFLYTQATQGQVTEGENSFAIKFDSFSELAEFFTALGSTAAYNEDSNSLGNREIYDGVARELAQDSTLETAPGAYLVTFAGWTLT